MPDLANHIEPLIAFVMKHITLPDLGRERPLIFYLAMEEFVARELDEEGAFFIWQVEPTVIFGRNQLMESEVNIPYCKEHGIRMFRRKSGGGCVYSDKGNLMLSYVVRGENVGFCFDRYIRYIAFLLQKIGVDAKVSGRNDITVDGRKVSGNAFYKIPGKCIIHGTMLFDTNFDHLQQAISPSNEKLRSKGVDSVRQRVTNLKDYVDMDIETFKSYLIGQVCRDGERCLTDADVTRIEEIERTYTDEAFFSGKNPAYTWSRKVKTAKSGEIQTEIELRHGKIRSVHLSGDFFPLQDVDHELSMRLYGVSFEREAVSRALDSFDMSACVLGLTTNEWIEIITKP